MAADNKPAVEGVFIRGEESFTDCSREGKVMRGGSNDAGGCGCEGLFAGEGRFFCNLFWTEEGFPNVNAPPLTLILLEKLFDFLWDPLLEAFKSQDQYLLNYRGSGLSYKLTLTTYLHFPKAPSHH